jgi:hypothetical protein
MTRVKLFVDFWNFQLHWNDEVGRTPKGDPIKIPWDRVFPDVVVKAVGKKRAEAVSYAGTHVYASTDPIGDASLRRFLHAMDGFPGYAVTVKDRKPVNRPIRCTSCKKEFELCPSCKEKLCRTIEKGVDVAIVTDMIQMAYDNVYDVGVIGSNDSDLCQAMKFIQERIGKPIYHLWYPGVGMALRNSCWDHIAMHNLFADLGVPTT